MQAELIVSQGPGEAITQCDGKGDIAAEIGDLKILLTWCPMRRTGKFLLEKFDKLMGRGPPRA